MRLFFVVVFVCVCVFVMGHFMKFCVFIRRDKTGFL